MQDANQGLLADPVFVGATRPPMRWGATYTALLCNLVLTMELFLLSRNLLVLLLAVPIHGLCMLLCARDPRFFDLLSSWAKTSLLARLASGNYWHASSYSPLLVDLPCRRGTRGDSVTLVCALGGGK